MSLVGQNIVCTINTFKLNFRRIKLKFVGNSKLSFGCFFFFLFCVCLDTFLVKHVPPQSLSPPGTGPWKQQGGPPSPSSASSGSTSPAYSPSRTLDLSGSSTSFSSDRVKISTHQWKSGPVEEWNNEQVFLKLNF